MIADLRAMGVPARLGKLQFGDVAFGGSGPESEVKIGIELKTVTGLLGDMITGRFVAQAGGMQRAYRYRYLLVEGAARGSLSDGMLEVPRGGNVWWSPSPRMMYVDFLRILDDIRLRAGFHVLRSFGRMDTLHHIAAEYRGWAKPWDSHKALKHFNEAQPGVVLLHPPTLVRLWARDLPGVGWEKSAAVEKAFHTPLALALARESQWREVPGIGKTIAGRVWKAIRGIK